MWRWQLKPCWSGYCCWCWRWETVYSVTFLSDPSPIIGNAWLTDTLTNWLLFSKLDWCDSGMWRWQLKTCWSCYCCWFDDEKRVDNSLVQIWKVKFGHKVKFLFRIWGQGFKVWLRFWSWPSGKILKLRVGHYFAADAWLWLCNCKVCNCHDHSWKSLFLCDSPYMLDCWVLAVLQQA